MSHNWFQHDLHFGVHWTGILYILDIGLKTSITIIINNPRDTSTRYQLILAPSGIMVLYTV